MVLSEGPYVLCGCDGQVMEGPGVDSTSVDDGMEVYTLYQAVNSEEIANPKTEVSGENTNPSLSLTANFIHI